MTQGFPKTLPPAPILVVVTGLAVFIPLGSWALVEIRDYWLLAGGSN